MNFRANLPLILAILSLGVISLSVIFSINRQLATSQLIFWIFGMSLFLVFSIQRVQLWQQYTPAIYLVTIVSLLSVFLVGEEIRGSVRWIELGIFRFQPSEIAKITTIITLSIFYSKNTAKEAENVFKGFLIVAPIFSLILIEPDIGSALAIIAIWAGITYVAKISIRSILALLLISAVVFPVFFNFLEPYQKERLLSFINPGEDPLGSGYNIIQSKIAIGSGLLFGRGLGRGSQSQLNFLPEAESDFIFASTVEELGFIGGAAIILILGFILVKITAGMENKENFPKLLAVGTLALLSYQTTVNIGMNLGIIPVTGITLPMVSYGGSSLISTLILIGIVSSYKR